MNKINLILIIIFLSINIPAFSQTIRSPQVLKSINKNKKNFSRADSLRGKLTPLRTCFDVTFYDINLTINPQNKTIQGYNSIHYKTITPFKRLQIDLFANLRIDSIISNGESLVFDRSENAVFVEFSKEQTALKGKFTVYYKGKPRIAVKPPWDGGFVWDKDKNGNDWIAVACEGLGASSWFPLKDHLSDEPDSVSITTTVPAYLKTISNGVLRNEFPTRHSREGGNLSNWTTYQWFVSYPINSYNITLNIGDYKSFSDTFQSNNGEIISIDHYVLSYDLESAKRHFQQVKPMLRCFEAKFGPYPFPKDGYSLVETPYWGMEHQGAIAYGNHFINNEYGFDFIIIHESGHEWFGNSISASDHADLWIHEAFTTYSEFLFLECMQNYNLAVSYLRAHQSLIKNEIPILGPLDVNFENWGDADMYYKGASMLHTLRNLVANDSLWFKMLYNMNSCFRHSVVNADTIVNYICQALQNDYHYLFREYLGYREIPVFQYSISKKNKEGKSEFSYRWKANEADFIMPLEIYIDNKKTKLKIYPTTKTQKQIVDWTPENIKVDLDSYYVGIQQLK